MSSKNITVFETTYEKVLSIINKVKDFIKNNTKNFQNIIDELDWVSNVITNKTLYSYDINKSKLSDDNAKFSDFLTKYNEEIINLNKKHILVRGILSFKTNKEILKKPSLILKKISNNELTGLNYNDKTINKNNTVLNPLGKWLLDIVNKSQEENVKSNPNENNNSSININTSNENILKKEHNENNNNINSKSLSVNKNKKTTSENMHASSSLTSIINYKNQIKEINKDNKIKQTIYKNKNKKNSSYLRNKKNLNFYSVNKTMERYFKNEMEQLRKKNMQKSMYEKRDNSLNNMNDLTHSNKVDPESLNILIEKHFEFMKTIIDKDFNIFELKKLVGYKNVLPLMCHFMFKILGLIDPKIISIKKFVPFLINVSDGYLESTLYHNSLHGADVCHSLFLYILNSNLEEICETSVLDLLGLVVSATGHDLGHPGYNNNFHVNSNSELALTYNDISCLENFHTSTLFRILRKEENNIFENMDISDYKQIRKRIVNQILATDMINHAMVLSSVNAKISEWKMHNPHGNSENKKFVFLSGVEKTKFNEQQNMFNYLIHAADLGHNTQKFYISIHWVELLTQEFWNQGDKEKEKNLNVSFLCDRNNVDVPPSQVGFLRGFIINTFEILATMFPSLEFALNNAKDNIKEWQKLADQKRRTGWSPVKERKDEHEDDNKKI